MPRHPLLLLLTAALLATAAPAAAADFDAAWPNPPEPTPLPAAKVAPKAGGVLGAAKGAKARRGLGLPSYRSLLGKRWKRQVRRADRRFAAKLAGPRKVRAAAPTIPASIDDDPLKAKDVLRRGAERQKRSMRLAVAVADTCPRIYDDPGMGSVVHWQARAEHVVTTVERIRRHDVTTIVTFDLQLRGTAEADSAAVLGGPSVGWGVLNVTRQQDVRNRRTGKERRQPLQTHKLDVSPLWVLDGSFSDFVARNDDDAEAGPAPERKLRAAVWNQLAEKFTGLVYQSVVAALKPSADKIATPNACVTMDVKTPERLAPGQTVTLAPVLKTHMKSHYQQLFDSARLAAHYVDPQGATARPLYGSEPPQEGRPWFEFTAPPQSWPEDRPVGMTIRYSSHLGVAETTVLFRPLAAFPYRYRVTGASFNVFTTGDALKGYCAPDFRVTGTRRFSGGGAPVPTADEPSLDEVYGGELEGDVFVDLPSRWSDDTTTGCELDDDFDKVACARTHADRVPAGDGLWRVGFSIRADGPSARTAELHWAVPDPEIGFFDAGDEECFAYLWTGRAVADDVQHVPMEKLTGSGPQTFTFSGSRTWDRDHAGDPAVITQTWTYELTIERVE